jgi:hypothetical protein
MVLEGMKLQRIRTVLVEEGFKMSTLKLWQPKEGAALTPLQKLAAIEGTDIDDWPVELRDRIDGIIVLAETDVALALQEYSGIQCDWGGDWDEADQKLQDVAYWCCHSYYP